MIYSVLKSCMILSLCTVLSIGISCSQRDKLSNVSRIAIYYHGWNVLTYAQMTCEDLKARHNPIVISDPDKIREFVKVLESAKLEERTEYDGLDVRICCMLEDSTGNVIVEVSFSETSLMQIDGKIYNTDERLFSLVLRYLPADYLTR